MSCEDCKRCIKFGATVNYHLGRALCYGCWKQYYKKGRR